MLSIIVKMKTFIYIQLALFISSIVSCNSRDEDVVIYYHYDKNKKEAEVIAGEKKYSGDLVIPSTTTLNDTVYLVTRIGKSAFDFCTDLTSVEIPGSVTYIGVRAFADCRQLTTIEIPNSVKYIAEQAFQRCKGLTSATLPNKLKSINCVTFNECVHLASIEIPQSVTSIEDFAFGHCYYLSTVVLPDSLESIGEEAFGRCYSLTSIQIPQSVKTIGFAAFCLCVKLDSIFIPSSVTYIGNSVVECCLNLASIEVDANNTNYDSRDSCNAIIETSTNRLISGCQNTVIPQGISSIANDAFYYCSYLASVVIPQSVTTIGRNAFTGCSGLTSIKVDPGNAHYDSRDDCNALIETSKNKLIVGCRNTVIPQGITSIDENAFRDCTELTSIEIPMGVTKIGWCSFIRCTSLTSINFPSSVTTIESSAFKDCTNITSIKVEGVNPPTIDKSTFENIDKKVCVLHIPKGSKEAYRNAQHWNEFQNVVEMVE